jgi:hypothetical protein
MVEGGFCMGFCGKWCVERGFLLVNLWWFAGRSWCVDGVFQQLKIFHFFQVYFREAFPLWGCWFVVKVLPG